MAGQMQPNMFGPGGPQSQFSNNNLNMNNSMFPTSPNNNNMNANSMIPNANNMMPNANNMNPQNPSSPFSSLQRQHQQPMYMSQQQPHALKIENNPSSPLILNQRQKIQNQSHQKIQNSPMSLARLLLFQ